MVCKKILTLLGKYAVTSQLTDGMGLHDIFNSLQLIKGLLNGIMCDAFLQEFIVAAPVLAPEHGQPRRQPCGR
jgi:hypothetical protein